MDLWIRSQDKRELRPNPKLGIDEVENKFYIVDRYDFERANILGTYKTKERALEVLDEIQNAILGILSLEDIEEQKIKQYTGFACLSKVTNCLVYEIPKEWYKWK